MQDNPAVLCSIKNYELAMNEIVVDTKRDLDAFRQKSSNWCNELKAKLKKENASKRRDYNIPSVIQSKISGRECLTQGSMKNVINIAEAHIHIGNESISCRTRGALKALQNSVLGVSIAGNQTETQKTRGRSRIRRTKQDDIIKRSAEEDTLGVDLISKKIKQEKLSMIETPKKSEEEFFKKPKPRGRKPRKEKQSDLIKNVTSDLGAEESITFNAVLHSSPNGNTGESTFLLSPKNLSVIPKSQVLIQNLPPKKEIDHPMTPSSNVNNFMNDGECENSKLNKNLMIEEDIGQNENNETTYRRSSRHSKELTKDLVEIPKINSSKSDVIINDEKIKKISLKNSESKNLVNNIKNSELLDNGSSVKEINKNDEILEKDLEGKIIGNDDDVIDSLESNSTGNRRKSGSNRQKLEKVIRETRSVKSGCEIQSSNIKSTSEVNEDAVSLHELNITKVVSKATKRTKPVLKSRIFDSKGNILPPAVTEKNSVNTNTPEKPYSIRSSFTREIIIKKEIVDSDVSDTKKSVETKEIYERRSNVENEPKAVRTKRTKTKKTELAVDGTGDTGRITRTKSKKAKEALEEAVAKKTGLIEFARKSLNKAKLISLQKDQPKIKLPLVNILSSQKRQISLSKLHTGLKEDILGSSNKLNALPIKNSIVNLGSQVKMSKVNCSKNNENLLTGKGKYQNLFTDSKDKYITPLKRCLSPSDFSVKSTSKTTREEEIEKELKLRALKEKEEEALLKREMTIKMRQKELKERNEKKLELATKQRKKLEMERYNCKIQLEKEKEEKRKLILQEREMKKKEKAMMKKKLMEQKLAETEERRRLEEEARIAKLREQEAEQQRLMMEKQKELERHEKRAQERLAEQKARENYEMKLKTEQMLREKQQQQIAAQFQSANKATTTKGYPIKKWNYKPRNENDFGLDDEESDVDSEKEGSKPEKSRPVPKWAQRVMSKHGIIKCLIKKEAMMEYMMCHQKTPDIQKMFKMTPTKRIKRTSSAIWNTPSS